MVSASSPPTRHWTHLGTRVATWAERSGFPRAFRNAWAHIFEKPSKMIESHPMPTAASKTTKRQRTRDGLLIAAQEILLDRDSPPLSIRTLAARAGVVQGTFYNYFKTIDDVLDSIAVLLATEHQRMVNAMGARQLVVDERVALITRMSFRLFEQATGFGRILFDSGLPIDRFVAGLRLRMVGDLQEGVREGRFRFADLAVARTLYAGAMFGAALDIHRRVLLPESIPATAEHMLLILGVEPARARELANKPATFPDMMPLPLSHLRGAP